MFSARDALHSFLRRFWTMVMRSPAYQCSQANAASMLCRMSPSNHVLENGLWAKLLLHIPRASAVVALSSRRCPAEFQGPVVAANADGACVDVVVVGQIGARRFRQLLHQRIPHMSPAELGHMELLEELGRIPRCLVARPRWRSAQWQAMFHGGLAVETARKMGWHHMAALTYLCPCLH